MIDDKKHLTVHCKSHQVQHECFCGILIRDFTYLGRPVVCILLVCTWRILNLKNESCVN